MKDQSQDTRQFVRERYRRLAEDHLQGASATSCCSGPSPAASEPSACCSPSTQEADLDTLAIERLYQAPDAGELPDSVTAISLGCGDPITLAELRPGETVVDLGSGGGIDCFLAGRRVGPEGRVIGVDMTPAMLETARANRSKLGADNVEFRLGEIENLPVADGVADVVISNCVINLSPDKPRAIAEAFRVLRPGGRFAVSDMVTAGPLPAEVLANADLWAECVAGAVPAAELARMLEDTGFEAVQVDPSVPAPQETPGDITGPAIPVQDAGALVYSARITARKPTTS